MNRIDVLQKRLASAHNLVQLQPMDIETLQRETPNLPEDYLQFLSVIGYGDLGDLQLYSGPVSPDSIYPEPKADSSRIVLFGDDFQGYCFGFDTWDNFSVVEMDPKGGTRSRSEGDFLSLIESYVPDQH